MNRKQWIIAEAILFLGAALALAQPFDLSWHTVDGGGHMVSTGGTFALGGTIGQPDAGPIPIGMSGGTFTLVGGFWPAASAACTCPGDMDADGLKNGRDISLFSSCMVAGGNCSCADVDGVPGLSAGDISVFVNDLLAGAACP